MKGQSILFSKQSDDWRTPPAFYDKLDQEFHFNFDPCPYQSTFDGLLVPWKGSIFINPPYSNIKGFLAKAAEERENRNSTVQVWLVPSRTDTIWFHSYVYNQAELRFIKGRIKFVGAQSGAPFPSMVAIFRT